jgi:uncharacterized delta-60 repeat protein
MKRVFSSSVKFAFLLLFTSLAQAAPGDLDTSFAGTGKSRIGFGFESTSGGNFSMVRFDTNHVLDASFGDGGKVVTPVGTDPSYAQANAMGIQADGKIVLAGYAYAGTNYQEFALARYNTNGALDTSFGTNGIVFTDFGQGAVAEALGIQADSKIVVAGSASISGNGYFALARYNTNGTLDTTFGSGGKVTTDASSGASAYALILQGDGTIIAVGQGGAKFALLRYTTNGVLDGTFGSGGKVFTPIGSSAIGLCGGDSRWQQYPTKPEPNRGCGHQFNQWFHRRALQSRRLVGYKL